MAALLEGLQNWFFVAICTIGFITFTNKILKVISWVWSMFLRPPKKLTTYGSWALVTGCTDGIGKALSFELASKGLNLILVGRNIQKLQDTSNEIRQRFDKNTQIKTIVIDFASASGEEIEGQIRKETEGLDVGVVVNNVGLSSAKAKFFHEVNLDDMNSLVSVNMNSVTWVTKAVLPGMLKRKKGAVVNIGSGSTVAVPSYPLFAIYAATKGYVAMFSKSLSVEYQQSGIDIQCQVPLLVATKMASIRKSSFFIPSPEQYSKASIRWIGYEHLCVPYWTHVLEWCIMSAFPDALIDRLILKKFLNLRKKLIQKELMKQKK